MQCIEGVSQVDVAAVLADGGGAGAVAATARGILHEPAVHTGKRQVGLGLTTPVIMGRGSTW
jgi:ethanolamine ammonia-lyase small subunit